jgi:hypothetical protein
VGYLEGGKPASDTGFSGGSADDAAGLRGDTNMQPQRDADHLLRELHKYVRYLERGIITPVETANALFDRLAYSERYDLADEVMGLSPPPVQDRLKAIAEEVSRPNARYRTFAIGPGSPQAREEHDRLMHSRAVRLAAELRRSWDGNQAGPSLHK